MDEVFEKTKMTPHPSAFGCHLLPQEKAFLCAESKEKPREAGQVITWMLFDEFQK